MWIRVKDKLINLNHVSEIKKHFNSQKRCYEVYAIRPDGTYGPCLASNLDEERTSALLEAIADAIASGERFFDVDEFLALSKLQEAKK